MKGVSQADAIRAHRAGPAPCQHGGLRGDGFPSSFPAASGRGSRSPDRWWTNRRRCLLDEPLGALDFKLRVAMQKMLKDIQRKVGITFIYVTHDQTEALTMSDRIAVMKDGHVHQIGTPDEIYNSPATAFVASFIGDMNFLHGRLVSSDGSGCSVDVNGRALKAAPLACFAEGGAARPGDEVLRLHPHRARAGQRASRRPSTASRAP